MDRFLDGWRVIATSRNAIDFLHSISYVNFSGDVLSNFVLISSRVLMSSIMRNISSTYLVYTSGGFSRVGSMPFSMWHI